MKTILCPVDFTLASENVSKYAAQLANEMHAKVVLVPAYTKPEKASAMQKASVNYEITNRLGELHDQLATNYHIPCAVDEENLSGNICKKLSQLADHYDMLMVGMKPTQDNPVNSAGIDLLKLIHETLVPIYFVPERSDCRYKRINRITYAFDPKQEPNPPLLTLYWLADWFDADVKFVSVLPTNISLRERGRLTTAQQFVENEWNSSRKLSFEAIVQDDIPTSLESHVWSGDKNDLLILSVNHSRISERIWQKSVVKRLLKNALNPYLIIHR